MTIPRSDDCSNLSCLQKAFRSRRPTAALAWLNDGHVPPDIILLDLMMPGMDGWEVFRETRRSGITAPIIFCSAYGAEKANSELGGQGAIDKPFNPDFLVKSIQAATEGGAER